MKLNQLDTHTHKQLEQALIFTLITFHHYTQLQTSLKTIIKYYWFKKIYVKLNQRYMSSNTYVQVVVLYFPIQSETVQLLRHFGVNYTKCVLKEFLNLSNRLWKSWRFCLEDQKSYEIGYKHNIFTGSVKFTDESTVSLCHTNF